MLSGVATRRHFFSTATHLGCTFHLPLSTSTSSKKKKTAFFLPTKTSLPKNTNQSTMADCGCAPKCACGAEKIGEFRLPFSFERGLCFSVGLKNSTKKKTHFSLSLSLFFLSFDLFHTQNSKNSRLQVLLQRLRREVRLRKVRVLQEGRRRRGLLRRRRGVLRGRLLLRDRVRGSFFFFLSFFFSFLLTGRENEKKTDSFWILSLFLLRQQQVQVQGDVRCDVLKSRNKEEAEISFFMSFYLSQKKKGRTQRKQGEAFFL